MVVVAGLWELGWNTPIKELDLWEYPLRDYAVDTFIMSPVSGISSSSVTECPDLGVWLAEARSRGAQIVFVDEKGLELLDSFTHPSESDGEVVYVLGKASVSAFGAYGQSSDRSVRIRTPGGLGLLWPHQAISVVLYDRYMKARV